MQIYVVRKGDSLWQLAKRYGTAAERLAAVNGIANHNLLAVGQALVIPDSSRFKRASSHMMMGDDSMSSVAQQYGLTLTELMDANYLSNPALAFAGLTLSIPPASQTSIEVNAYVQPGADSLTAAKSYSSSLTYLSPFSYAVSPDGSLAALDDEALIKTTVSGGASPMMVVSNFEGNTFSTATVRRLLNSAEAKSKLQANVLAVMQNQGYTTLNVDFEYIPAEDKELFHELLRQFVSALHPHGYLVSSALPPKTTSRQRGLLYEGHDYAAQASIVDFVILMTYEWGWFGGSPMAVAPLNEVNKVVRYAVSVIPPNKILMGMPMYGYDWTLPYKKGTTAETVSPQEAVSRAIARGAAIQYDRQAESPFYTYYDHRGNEHIVWFEDARSVQAKYNLVKSYGLRGVSFWVLGIPFAQNWHVLNNDFSVIKLEQN